MECRKCHKEYKPTQYDINKSDFICLECKRKYQAEWRDKRIIAGLPAYGSRTWDPEKKKAWWVKMNNNPEFKKHRAAQMREYRKDPTIKRRNMARWALHHQKESGMIVSAPCAFCGGKDSEAHHPDYDKPLLIVWLCRECHRKIHPRSKQNPARYYQGKGHINKWIDGVHHCVKNKYLRPGVKLETNQFKCSLCGKISPAKTEGRE